ncbi:MAG: GyrI-like domain-containing protein [Brooklawnia sp.]|uniref:GyrI-like domain-containing protein n=1 Tax=Brooklawnia sp. TaxID=2699740 RepID=UPI003C7792AD
MSEQPTSIQNPEIITVEPQPTAVVIGTMQMAELSNFFDSSYQQVAEAVQRQGVTPHEAFGYYPRMPTDTIEVEVGFTTSAPISPDGNVVASQLPGGEVAHATYVGAYDGLRQAYGDLFSWLQSQGRQPGSAMWEVYVTEPTPQADPGSMVTELYWTLA